MKNIDYLFIPKLFSYEELVNIHNMFEQNTDDEIIDIPAEHVTKKAKVYM